MASVTPDYSHRDWDVRICPNKSFMVPLGIGSPLSYWRAVLLARGGTPTYRLLHLPGE